jgi:lysophospholipase L1-like esterase
VTPGLPMPGDQRSARATSRCSSIAHSKRRLTRWWRIGLRSAGAGYVVLLHVLLVVLILKTNFLLLAGKTLGLIPPEEWTLQFYAAILAQAEQDARLPPASVILLGDSIIAELNPQEVADDAVNFGLGGDTTNTLYRRLAVLHSIVRSRVVIVEVGVNDLKYRAIGPIVSDYRKVLGRLAAVPRVVVMSVLPVDPAGQAARERPYLQNQTIETLNRGLHILCRQQMNCHFLDAWPAIAASQSNIFGSDGWHLSDAGRHVLAGLMRNALTSSD